MVGQQRRASYLPANNHAALLQRCLHAARCTYY
jgi:hypothetical protein